MSAVKQGLLTFQLAERLVPVGWRVHLQLAHDASKRDSGIGVRAPLLLLLLLLLLLRDRGAERRDSYWCPEAALQRTPALHVPTRERRTQRRVVRLLELRAALAPQACEHVLHEPAPRLHLHLHLRLRLRMAGRRGT